MKSKLENLVNQSQDLTLSTNQALFIFGKKHFISGFAAEYIFRL